MVTAIVLASGKASRMGNDVDKCFLALGPKPVVAWSLLAFEKCSDIDRIILTVRRDQMIDAKGLQTMFGISKLQTIVIGGKRRQDSVLAALKELEPDTRYVVIHDAARPCVTPDLIRETLKFAKRYGSGIAATPVVDTVKIAAKGMMTESTPDRSALWAVQTPQSFEADALVKAYTEFAGDRNRNFTDDASVLEAAGIPARLVRWEEPNIKITRPIDLTVAAALLKLN